MNNKLKAVVIGAVALLALAGCSSKQVDQEIVGATKVAGTYNLYWFCNDSTLIYYEDWTNGEPDEYVALFSWGCDSKGKPTKELPGTLGDGNGGDTGNGDK